MLCTFWYRDALNGSSTVDRDTFRARDTRMPFTSPSDRASDDRARMVPFCAGEVITARERVARVGSTRRSACTANCRSRVWNTRVSMASQNRRITPMATP
jgi:hypothetical protein